MSRENGFSFVSILAVLLIAGLIYVGYFHLRSGSAGQPVMTGTKEAAQATACQMNRQAVERAMMTWEISHPGGEPTLEALKEAGIPVLPCPAAGQFTMRGRNVYCSVHTASR